MRTSLLPGSTFLSISVESDTAFPHMHSTGYVALQWQLDIPWSTHRPWDYGNDDPMLQLHYLKYMYMCVNLIMQTELIYINVYTLKR